MPVDSKYGLPVWIRDVDFEFPSPRVVPVPFDQAGQHKVVLTCRKTRCVELIEDAAGIEFARTRGLNVTTELEQFLAHHASKGTLFADIDAGWRKWCGLAVKFATERMANRPGNGGVVSAVSELMAQGEPGG